MALRFLPLRRVIPGVGAIGLGLALGLAPGVARAPRPPDAVLATFTGAIHGAIPTASCSTSGDDPGGLPVSSFDETTPANAPDGSGTFELEIVSTCVAPFYQALLSHESLRARLTFNRNYRSSGRAPLVTLSLANARLTHVDFGVSDSGGTGLPGIRIGIASQQVTAGTPTVAHRTKAPSMRTVPTPIAMSMPEGSAQGWARGGMLRTNVHLSSASPSMDASFTEANFFLSVRSPPDAAGMPTSNLEISVHPLTKPVDQKTAQIEGAAAAHASLTRAVFTVVGIGGTAGITVRLKGGHLSGDRLSTTSEVISLTASQITITDIGSGRTASMP